MELNASHQRVKIIVEDNHATGDYASEGRYLRPVMLIDKGDKRFDERDECGALS
jgi:hypothetical protein